MTVKKKKKMPTGRSEVRSKKKKVSKLSSLVTRLRSSQRDSDVDDVESCTEQEKETISQKAFSVADNTMVVNDSGGDKVESVTEGQPVQEMSGEMIKSDS